MIYRITRFIFAAFFKLYYKRITIIGQQNLTNKPTILAVNHPNSLMDALILGVVLKQPIYSLARGDAFKKKWAAKILKAYNMLPIYRQSEGVANLHHNANTFEICQQILIQNKTILIFVEGLCENNWQLRPLKKGVARLAQQAWLSDKTAHTQIIPVALTYQHFNGAGKSLIINFGNAITNTSLDVQQTTLANPLNQIIQNRLQHIMLQYSFLPNTEAHKNFDSYWFEAEKKYAGIELFNALKKFNNQTATSKPIYNKFAFTIFLWPHYLLCKYVSKRLTIGTVFFDSVLFMLLVFCFPVYLIIVWLFIETLGMFF